LHKVVLEKYNKIGKVGGMKKLRMRVLGEQERQTA